MLGLLAEDIPRKGEMAVRSWEMGNAHLSHDPCLYGLEMGVCGPGHGRGYPHALKHTCGLYRLERGGRVMGAKIRYPQSFRVVPPLMLYNRKGRPGGG